jgi:hypothetical protein
VFIADGLNIAKASSPRLFYFLKLQFGKKYEARITSIEGAVRTESRRCAKVDSIRFGISEHEKSNTATGLINL